MDGLHESLLRPVLARLDIRSKCVALSVCRDWHLVATLPEFWQVIDLPECEEAHKLDFHGLLVLLARSNGSVERLNLASNMDAGELQDQQRFELGLKSTDTLPYTRGLRAHCLASLCSGLRELILDERTSCIGGMTDDLAKALSASCPELRRLEVLFACYSLPCELFTDIGMATIAEGCPGLQQLALVNCCCVTNRALYALAAYCKGLQQLKLVGYNEQITDLGVSVLLESCHDLKSVDFCSKLNRVTDFSAAAMARCCPSLRSVHLTSGITAEGIKALAAGCVHLQSLGLEGCHGMESSTTRDIIGQCKELARLTLPAHVALTDVDVKELSKMGCKVEMKHGEGFTEVAVKRTSAATGEVPMDMDACH